jgi:glycosyltransferase 2 family protein
MALVGILLGLAAISIAAYFLGISQRQVLAQLGRVPPAPLLAAAGGALVLLGLQSLRWWIVMRPVVGLRYPQAYAAMAVGFLFNVMLPARAGDLIRVQYLGKKTGTSRAKLLGTELVDFWSDKWGWIASFPIVCLSGQPPPWLFRALALLGSVVVGVAALLAILARTRRGPTWLANLRAGFAANHWKRLLLVETLVAPLPWLWEIGVIMVAARAFDLSLSPMGAFAVLTAFNVATVVPSPANLGSYETGGTLALVLLGVDKDTALAFLVAYHVTQVVPGVVLGGALLAAEGYGFLGRRLRELEPSPQPVADGGPLPGEDGVHGAVADSAVGGGHVRAQDAVEARAQALDGGA